MRSPSNPNSVVTGIVALAVGLTFLYFGLDFENTNIQAFVYADLLEAGLQLLGFFLTGFGIFAIVIGFFTRAKLS